MERRRFVPTGDFLEVRQVMSSFTNTSLGRINTEVPLSTLAQRTQRIERLPAFLQSIDRNATVQAGAAVASIQANLGQLLGTMHASSRNGLVAMNSNLRGVIKQQTISAAQAAQLNDTFGKILLSGGANASTVANLQNGMNDLTRAITAAESRNASLAANSYALVLQLALAVGKPLPAPGVPRLAKADISKGNRNTTNPQPTLVGNYESGTFVQIIASGTNDVIGSAPVAPNGEYRVQIATPLPPGTYTVRIRAIAPQGALSLQSRPFKFTVVQATPKGPAGMFK